MKRTVKNLQHKFAAHQSCNAIEFSCLQAMPTHSEHKGANVQRDVVDRFDWCQRETFAQLTVIGSKQQWGVWQCFDIDSSPRYMVSQEFNPWTGIWFSALLVLNLQWNAHGSLFKLGWAHLRYWSLDVRCLIIDQLAHPWDRALVISAWYQVWRYVYHARKGPAGNFDISLQIDVSVTLYGDESWSFDTVSHQNSRW